MSQAVGPSRNWEGSAACRDADPELFYEEGLEDRAIRLYCNSCLVKSECLQVAMAAEAQTGRYGVWGGTRPLGRRKLYDRMRVTVTNK
jgi:WhiB family redox-sensing transcriptional regulator